THLAPQPYPRPRSTRMPRGCRWRPPPLPASWTGRPPQEKRRIQPTLSCTPPVNPRGTHPPGGRAASPKTLTILRDRDRHSGGALKSRWMGTVTVAATYGAGGSVIAPAVANRLGLP